MSVLNINAPHHFSAMSSLMTLWGNSDQWNASTAGGDWSKTNTNPSARPVAAGQAMSRCNITLNPVECPMDWVQAYVAKWKEPLAGGQSSSLCTKGPPKDLANPKCKCWPSIRLWVSDCLHPRMRSEACWNPPPSLSILGHQDFFLHCDFQGIWDIWETQKEQTLVIAKVLQCCA